MPLIAPSMLAANFGFLAEEAQTVARAGADWLHIDVMDGRFVPNISFGSAMVELTAQYSPDLPRDVHLMIAEPERYLDEFAKKGASYLTVHLEACPHLQRTLQQIKSLGCMAGVALNPHTSPQLLEYVLGDLDLILVMAVNPGYGGQKFLNIALEKVRCVKEMCHNLSVQPLIQVDGGVGPGNAADLIRAGADVLVAGTAVFGQSDYAAAIQSLRNISKKSK